MACVKMSALLAQGVGNVSSMGRLAAHVRPQLCFNQGRRGERKIVVVIVVVVVVVVVVVFVRVALIQHFLKNKIQLVFGVA